MTNIEFKRFTNPRVLGAIRVKHLAKFFDGFRDILEGRNLPLPRPETMAGTELYDTAWIEVLNMPEKLPDAFVEAILAIEELAAPENRSRLDAALRQAQVVHPWLDPAETPECLALQLWLLSPYQRETPAAPALSSPNTDPSASPNSPFSAPVASPPSAPVADQTAGYVFPGASSQVEQPAAEPHLDEVPGDAFGDSPLPDRLGANGSQSRATGSTDSNAQPATSQLSIDSPPLPYGYRRHTGKIGRLPAEVREAINCMIYDGVSYATVLERLGEAGKGLTRYDLTRWKKGGYREWLQEQKRKELTLVKEQFALEVLREKDASKLHEAPLQIVASQLCQLFADFDPAALKEKLEKDPLNFVRLLNALSKLSESGLKCESHRIEMRERQVKLEKPSSSKPSGLSDEARRLIEKELNLM